MSLPDDLKPDLHRMLLGPLSLADEIFGAFLPGCLFTLLLLLKRVQITNASLAFAYLGYRTKVACVLLLSYVFGKVALGVITLIEEIGRKNKAAATKSGTFFDNLPAELLYFLGGMVVGPLLSGKSRNFEYFIGFRVQILFNLSTGLLLSVVAVIPGDGNFRFLEIGVGIVLLLRGIIAMRNQTGIVAGIAGMAIGERLGELPIAELVSIAAAVAKVLSHLGQPQAANQATPPASPVQTKQPDATPSPSVGPNTPTTPTP